MPIPWKAAGIAALCLGALAYPAAWAVDRAAGEDLLVVDAADAASVEANRGLWELNGSPKDEVPSIYGTPSKAPTRILFAGAGSVLRPKEDPAAALYLRRAGGHPLQAQTLYYFALPTAVGCVLAGAAMLWIARRARGRPQLIN